MDFNVSANTHHETTDDGIVIVGSSGCEGGACAL